MFLKGLLALLQNGLLEISIILLCAMLCTLGSCDHIHSVSAVTVTYFRCFSSSWKPGGCYKMNI